MQLPTCVLTLFHLSFMEVWEVLHFDEIWAPRLTDALCKAVAFLLEAEINANQWVLTWILERR